MADHVCPWWAAYSFDNRLRRLLYKPEVLFKPYVTQGMTVLDVGSGMGFNAIFLATVVGDDGAVIAVDLQQRMLDVLETRARQASVAHRIRTHRCDPDSIGISDAVDFVVAFWMVHEVPDTHEFLRQVRCCLKPRAKFLIAEPLFHVSAKAFEETLAAAREVGYKLCDHPKVRLSRTAVLAKGEE